MARTQQFSLRNAGALVTGASRGIGAETARILAARGARVALLARTEAALAEQVEQLGGRGLAIACDVADRANVTEAVEQAAQEFGSLDVVVCNAGIGADGLFVDADPATLERVIAVNVLGTINTIHCVLPAMIARKRGRIVVVGSIAGRIGVPMEAVYSASKFALEGLVEALRAEIAHHNIAISIVSPGPVDTAFAVTAGAKHGRQFPRPLAPTRVATAIVDAAQSGAPERVLPSWFRGMDVLRAVAPRFVDFGMQRSQGRAIREQEKSAPQ